MLIGLYLLLALATSLIVPLGESPDELDHFGYIRFLVQERRFPVMDPDPAKNETMEANQPPLYYLAGAAATGWLPLLEPVDFPANSCFSIEPDDPGRQTFYVHSRTEAFPYQGSILAFHLARGLSIMMGAVTILLTYWIARRLAPGKPETGWLAAAFLAFNPQFIYITASVNNDALTALLGAAIILLSVIALARPSWTAALGLGLLVGLGLLTKFGLLALWPVALLAVAWSPFKQFIERFPLPGASGPPGVFALLGKILLVFVLPLLVSGWWYWRAQQLYGDPLTWDVHLQAKGLNIVRTAPFTGSDLLEFIRLHFQSYWALFGWLNVQVPDWMYLIFLLLVLIGAAGMVVLAAHHIRRRKRPAALVDGVNVPGLVLVLLSVAVIYLSLLRYIQTINWSGYQGRLAYAVAAPVAVLLALGWRHAAIWLESRVNGFPAVLATIVPVGMLGLMAVVSLFFVLPQAYPRPTIYQQPLDASRTCTRFNGGLLIEGYDAPDVVQPGDAMPVTLYGYGLRDTPEPQQIKGQLVGRDGRIVAQATAALKWQAGQVVSTTLLLPVTANSQPARGVLQIGIQDKDAGWQTATSANGRILETPYGLQVVKIAPAAPFLPTPQQSLQATFGRQLALIGFDVVGPGPEEATITLYWQALAPMSNDYTTFIHLLDEDGQLVAQADSQPQDGAYPTSIWDEGEIVADTKAIRWTAELGDNPYSFWVGVYLLPAVEPLPLDGSALQEANGFLPDAFLLLDCPDMMSCEMNSTGGRGK